MIKDFLTDLVFEAGPGRTQRRGRKILAEGPRAPATVTGIRVRKGTESMITHEWGVEVRDGGGTWRASCRQPLPDEAREVVRLGMTVEVAHREREVVLCWDANIGMWEPLKKPVPDGVDDGRLPKLRGTVTPLELEAWRPKRVLGLERDGVELLLGGAWLAAEVPEWAGHLLAPGTVLGVDAKRRVDWLGALHRHGTGAGEPVPPSAEVPDDGPTYDEQVRVVEGHLLGASDGDPGEVTFEQWVAVTAGLVRERVPKAEHDRYAQTHGVAPGAWPAAEAAWKGRMMREPGLGARFGAAYQAALKRR